MNFKYLLILPLLLGLQVISFGQNIEQYIPAKPSVIVHIKPSILQRGINTDEFNELPLVQNMMKSIQGMFPLSNDAANEEGFTLKNLGIAGDRDMYFYMKMDEGGTVAALVMNILDANKFGQTVKDMNLGDGEIMSNGSFKTKQFSDQFVSWGNDVAIVGNMSKKAPPFDPYADMDWDEENYDIEDYSDEDYVEEEIEEEVAEEMEEEIEVEELDYSMEEDEELINWKNEKLMQMLLANTTTPTWKNKLAKGEGVITAWLNYGDLMTGLQEASGGMDPTGGMMGNLTKTLYGGMEMLADMQFNQGEAVFKMDFKYPEKWMKGGDITSAKVNSKFKKYIKGDNLLGLYSVAFNPEAYGNMVKEMMLTSMDAIPQTMGLARDVAPLIGMLIDEEAIYNFLKGDMLIAFTGMKTYEKTTTEYQYDDDFNPIEKQVTSEAKVPEFTAMVSFGDRDNMQRIFNIGEKIGVLAPNDGYYQIMAPLGFDMFMAMQRDILFFSNDTDLITQNLSSGISNRIAGNRWKSVKKNSFHLYWDLPLSLNMASEFGFPISEETINMSRESIREIVWSSPRNQGSELSTELKLAFVNEKENSLKLILNFFNDIFNDLFNPPGRSM